MLACKKTLHFTSTQQWASISLNLSPLSAFFRKNDSLASSIFYGFLKLRLRKIMGNNKSVNHFHAHFKMIRIITAVSCDSRTFKNIRYHIHLDFFDAKLTYFQTSRLTIIRRNSAISISIKSLMTIWSFTVRWRHFMALQLSAVAKLSFVLRWSMKVRI